MEIVPEQQLQDSFCLEKSNNLHTYILSTSTSQDSLLGVLKQFFSFPTENCPTDVLLLIANMNELSKDTINHARILIEEIEFSCKRFESNKVVFFVLHFPPDMFYNHCYPTLFLHGWQHIYLDEIKTVNHLNTEKWLRICLLEENIGLLHEERYIFDDDSILKDWLNESILLDSGNVAIKQLKDFPPNGANGENIRNYWIEMLCTKDSANKEIYSVIKERFYSFWQHEAMYQLTSQIAHHSRTYHSSCTISQAVQETIKSSYKELVLFFLCIINQNFVLHTLNQHNDNIELKRHLVCKFLAVLGIPDSIKHLQLEVAFLTLHSHKNVTIDFTSPRFPFFNLIFDSMQRIINQAFKESAQLVDIKSKNSASTSESEKDYVVQKAKSLIATAKVRCIIGTA